MPFQLRPVLKSDAEQWTKLMFDSYADDPAIKLLYPVPASPAVIEWSINRTLKAWGQNTALRLMQIVEMDTGDVVAGAEWMFLPQQEGDEWRKIPEVHFHDDYNKENWATLLKTVTEMRHDIMGSQPYVLLNTLVTHPKYRRQGAASILLEWGIQQAAAANLPTYLLASPRGQPLYLKKGFKAVRESLVYTDSSKTQILRTGVCMIFDAPDPSSPPKSPITAGKFFVEPVTQETDFLKLAEIEAAAFSENRVVNLCFPQGPSGKRDSQVLEIRGKGLFKDSQKSEPECRYAKATDTSSGEMVAWALCYFYNEPLDPSKPGSADKGEGWPPTASAALCDHFFGELDRRRKDCMGGRRHALMSVVATRPEHQRQGIGAQLLKWILDLVDEKRYDCWINASAKGLELYKRFGWVEEGFVDLDLGKWGGEEGVMDRTVCLERKARGKA